MTFKYNFYSLNLNLPAYTRALLNTLRTYNERAGQAWIDAAVNRTPIPTWSGASRATFQKLAAELGTTVPIGPIRSQRDRTSLGKSSSAGSGVIEDPRSGYVGFIYETNLQYLAYNEYNQAVAGLPPQPFSNNVRFTPYNFRSRAHAAWLGVAQTAKLPNPYQYIKMRKVS